MSKSTAFQLGVHGKYPAGIWGYTGGHDLQSINRWTKMPARRTRIGRGFYKGAVTRLRGGDLLVNPAAKKTKHDDYIQHIFRSSDGAETWKLVNGAGPRGKESTLVTLSDGAVLLMSEDFWIEGERPMHLLTVWRSDDEGVSWTRCEAETGGLETTRSIIEEEDGSLFFVSSNGTWRDRNAPPSQAFMFRSHDGGRTWKEKVSIPAWRDPEPFFAESQMLRRPDGRLLCVSRHSGNIERKDGPPPYKPVPHGDEVGNHMLMRESLDNGRTWSEPWDILQYSCVHSHMAGLADGRILMTYTAYHLPFGVYAVLSEDEGRTFDMDHRIQLAISRDVFSGWASSAVLDDGSIVTVYALRPYVECDDPKESLWSDFCFEAVRWRLPG